MSDYNDMSLLEGIEYFFNAIKQKCFSKKEYAAELLKARVFLLEDNELALSDNSHRLDSEYLNRILTSEHIGEVQGNKIIIFPNANVEKIFYSSIQYGSESFLDYAVPFFPYDYVPKVYVGLLEKFVARYVKAISACGIQTHGSCDGNHGHRHGRRTIIVEISFGMYDVWYEIICKRLLTNRFNLKFCYDSRYNIIRYDRIEFNSPNKWKTYVELNRAAEFLYNHRIEIRQIRRKASDKICKGLSLRKIDKLPYIEEKFSESANKLFDEILIE